MLEVGLRFTSFGQLEEIQMVAPDDQLGWSYRPNAEGWWQKENRVYVRMNGEGFRDRDHEKAKPPDGIRIAVLGDSFVAAMEVPLESAFWAVAERELQQCPRFAGKRVEFINFGVRGYGTAQELLMLRSRVWQYSPDVVLLTFFAGNDLTDNSRALSTRGHEPPFFVLEGDQLVLDDSFRSSPGFRTLKAAGRGGWASIKRGLSGRMRLQSVLGAARGTFREWRRAAAGREPGVSEKVFVQPRNPNWKEAWRVTEAMLVKMSEEVTERGAGFLVVNLSVGIQVHPDPGIRKQYMSRVGAPDLFYPNRRIGSLGAQHGFRVLDLAPGLQQYAEQHGAFLHGFGAKGAGYGHWNEVGHRLAGEMIAREICSASPEAVIPRSGRPSFR